MLHLSGLLLLLLDPSMICGQTMQDYRIVLEERHNVTYEDNENFQNQDSPIHYSYCHEEVLNYYGGLCWEIFNVNMSELGKDNWCNMEMVIRNYNMLTECVENVCYALKCFYPNHVMEELFVRIHQQYFSSCNNEEDLPDAPAGVVLISTLLPILLIPFIVYIVIWKSSLRD
ncbi:receptor activity-modifying protein 1 isoform X1 [Carassius gibelio]|uniref:receptor activity-modifying protein 1 isoform X1 n=2 Tax=Carassius gibelio TaxID=101364 RepID=UPI002279A9F3|nr:receptor activity-modifying protein 1 isoform X1 [Carassius gibelio]